MIPWLFAMAHASPDASDEPLEAPTVDERSPATEVLVARERLALLEQTEDLALAARPLLDDRLEVDARAGAAEALGELGDPRALWFLRAGARDREPLVQVASARAALAYRGPEAVAAAALVLEDPTTPVDRRSEVVDALGEHQSDEAADALFALLDLRKVPPALRGAALEALETHYPSLLEGRGPTRSVSDPLGRLTLTTASGVAGGVVLSSIGQWGQFEGGVVIGAIGGSAIGIGAGEIVGRTRSVTRGQGLAYGSAVGWGLTYGLWATDAIHGAPRWLDDLGRSDDRQLAQDLGAAYRALGVGAGVAIGGWMLGRDPKPSDVFEVDIAGYLGAQIVRGATGLAAYRGPDDFFGAYPYGYTTYGYPTYGYPPTNPDWREPYEYELNASRWLAASSMAGGAIGLTTGLLLRDRWHLEPEDVAFAGVLGAEAAWIGAFAPAALEVDDNLKGNASLPAHLAMAAGFVAAEYSDIPVSRSAMTLTGAVAGNALGAGVPLLAQRDEEQAIARGMIVTSVLTTGGALALSGHETLDGGDWALLGLTTSVGAAQAGALGAALVDVGVLSEGSQAGGLALVTAGAASLGSLAVAPALEPDPGAMIVLGTGAAWGGLLGTLVPLSVGGEGTISDVLFPAVGVSAATMTGLGIALTPAVGLRPGQTVVPQISGVGGGTVGALVAALASDQGQDVALGTLIGSSTGLLAGSIVEAARKPKRQRTAAVGLSVPGAWMPSLGASLGPTGEPVPMLQIEGHGL